VRRLLPRVASGTSTVRTHGVPMLRVSSAGTPRPTKRVKPIGSRAHLYYDPVTGRKLSREERKR
jgi:hypothetical protein